MEAEVEVSCYLLHKQKKLRMILKVVIFGKFMFYFAIPLKRTI